MPVRPYPSLRFATWANRDAFSRSNDCAGDKPACATRVRGPHSPGDQQRVSFSLTEGIQAVKIR